MELSRPLQELQYISLGFQVVLLQTCLLVDMETYIVSLCLSNEDYNIYFAQGVAIKKIQMKNNINKSFQ